ncbi:uncharacterized protein LOC127046616 [Gopherus flavomarginatus]|uniref:uncharacterized protein LOC127046616 n=1 Tax=Gopherus flavomarginatus TaxID=286002 RepID=UPI0021CC4CFF|nr:uncharacterized protein LOC127046616 [Gopherus flavomarginatus]
MLERGHDRDTMQCRIKVKELRNAYCKAREGNRHSGAAPMTCRFYKELDAILGGDPTTNPRTTMDTSERGGEVEAEEKRGEEETESESTGVGGDTLESQEVCSQELFSSQEEGSQSQQPVLGEGQAEERVPATLSSQLPVLTAAQRLQNLWKKPRKSKDDLLQTVMDHSARENKKLQDWRERESRIHQRNAAARKKSTKQLISILARQVDSIHAGRALPRHPPIPKLFPLCPNVSSKPPSPASRFLPPPAASNTCTFTNQP